jgi:hypothetical protein
MIYGLVDPGDLRIRYVGKSSVGLERPRSHLQRSRLTEPSKKNSWLRGLVKRGLRPGTRILCVLHQDDGTDDWEAEQAILDAERWFINYFRDRGHDLLNMTRGGDGGDTGGGRKRRRGVVATNLASGVSKIYKFVLQTAKDGFNPSKVVAVCRGRRISHKGHTFRYTRGDPPPVVVSKRVRPVSLSRESGERHEFPSVTAAATFLGRHPSSVSSAMRRHGARIRGYKIEAKGTLHA